VPKERWKTEPDEHDYPAASSFLSLVAGPSLVGPIVDALRSAGLDHYKAKDLLRASRLALLPVDNPHVASDLAKVKAGHLLSPVLLVRGDLTRDFPLVIADGYHRVCASFHLDENADIPCRLVDAVALAATCHMTSVARRGPEPSPTGLDRAFRATVVLKGLDGVLETAGGVLLLFVTPASINRIVRWATIHELAEDPHDFIARHFLHAASQLSTRTTLFGAVYLLVHGAAKVVLVVFVLLGRLWAYPCLVLLLAVFVAYQTYRLTSTPSVGLAAFTAFDLVVAVLTWREYRARRAAARS